MLTLRSATYRKLSRSLLSRRTVVAPSSTHLCLSSRRHQSSSPVYSDREEDNYLSKYDPLVTLEMSSSPSKAEVISQYQKLSVKYANNKDRLDKIRLAHKILMNPQSSYYTKALPHQTDRHELLMEMVPSNTRLGVQFTIIVAVGFLVTVFLSVFYVLFMPTRKIMRAATR